MPARRRAAPRPVRAGELLVVASTCSSICPPVGRSSRPPSQSALRSSPTSSGSSASMTFGHGVGQPSARHVALPDRLLFRRAIWSIDGFTRTTLRVSVRARRRKHAPVVLLAARDQSRHHHLEAVPLSWGLLDAAESAPCRSRRPTTHSSESSRRRSGSSPLALDNPDGHRLAPRRPHPRRPQSSRQSPRPAATTSRLQLAIVVHEQHVAQVLLRRLAARRSREPAAAGYRSVSGDGTNAGPSSTSSCFRSMRRYCSRCSFIDSLTSVCEAIGSRCVCPSPERRSPASVRSNRRRSSSSRTSECVAGAFQCRLVDGVRALRCTSRHMARARHARPRDRGWWRWPAAPLPAAAAILASRPPFACSHASRNPRCP